jgi:hypothetical protein
MNRFTDFGFNFNSRRYTKGWLKRVPVIKNVYENSPRRLTVSLAESLMFRGAIKQGLTLVHFSTQPAPFLSLTEWNHPTCLTNSADVRLRSGRIRPLLNPTCAFSPTD